MKWLKAANKNTKRTPGKTNMQKSQIYLVLLGNLHRGQESVRLSIKMNAIHRKRKTVWGQNITGEICGCGKDLLGRWRHGVSRGMEVFYRGGSWEAAVLRRLTPELGCSEHCPVQWEDGLGFRSKYVLYLLMTEPSSGLAIDKGASLDLKSQGRSDSMSQTNDLWDCCNNHA